MSRLIGKWLRAGVMENGLWSHTRRGSSQRAIVSPIWANLYLQYVLDLWIHRKCRKPVGKRMGRTLQALRKALRRRMHRDMYEMGRWLGQVLRGWLQCYAVPTTFRSLGTFCTK